MSQQLEEHRALTERVSRLERLLVKLVWAQAREGVAEIKPYGKILAEIVAEYPNISDPQ